MALKVTREQVIAYRVAAQGLHRSPTASGSLAVLELGVQDSGPDAARLAFDARLAKTPPVDDLGPGRHLALTWSLRGAPHVHPRAELDAVAAGLWPLSEADATARLNETGPSVARAGIPALRQYTLAVDAMRQVVTHAMGKGAASTAVTRRIPKAMWRECRACKASHISDSAMRLGALSAGLEIEPGTSPPVLSPRPGARVLADVEVAAVQKLINAYLWLLGPASAADVAGYLDARRADLERLWPPGLAQVSVDGRNAWVPADRLAELTGAPAPDVVRLLGPFDPYLQARDRAVIVPDTSVHKALWPVLGRPGVLFIAGEVVGTWRTKASGKKLNICVESFVPLPPSVWTDVQAQAHRVAAVRAANDVILTRVG